MAETVEQSARRLTCLKSGISPCRLDSRLACRSKRLVRDDSKTVGRSDEIERGQSLCPGVPDAESPGNRDEIVRQTSHRRDMALAKSDSRLKKSGEAVRPGSLSGDRFLYIGDNGTDLIIRK